jgi:hypothetical protein
MYIMKTNYAKIIYALLFCITTITSCKQNEMDYQEQINPTPGPVNDAAQVTASISGIIIDENNTPIANATVTSGSAIATTNASGVFVFQNISVSKENGNVTAVKAGYFKGVRSFKTSAGKNHTVRLQLMQRSLTGTVNAATGGTITTNGGATIVFPPNAFATSSGAVYSGVVNIYCRWIDPTSNNLPFVMPGDLRGLNAAGSETILETYGMVGAELTDAAGNILKIAVGKKATINFPIPPSLMGTAPSTIVLWHFDDATARWKENGTATKTGNAYVGQVDKFSFWNVDVPSTDFINLDYTLINSTTNNPLVSTSTRIRRANGNYGYGITNNTGFVSGLVPKNEALILEVFAGSGCGTIFYSQNIGPFSSNTSLGNINVVIPATQTINFTGTLVNCSAAPVSNGYVSLVTSAGTAAFAATNATGNFSFSVLNCAAANVSYNYQGTDYTTNQQSTILTGNTASGNVNLGNIAVCGTAATADIFVAGTENGIAKVWRNGVATNLSTLTDSAEAFSVFVSDNDVYVAGYFGQNACFWKNGVRTNLTNVNNSETTAFSIYVLGTDVYVAGEEYNYTTNLSQAKMWKNGIQTNLSSASNYSTANSIFVSGNDVYVGGIEKTIVSNGVNQKAVYWKNGTIVNLNGSALASESYSIYVSGSDVYVAGLTRGIISESKATYWKNGIPTTLNPNDNSSAFLKSIFVYNGDVYISGTQKNGNGLEYLAKTWKNGVVTNLSNNKSEAISIFVKNNDVYVVGFVETNSNYGAQIWKNGIVTNFLNFPNNIDGYSIFVK